MNPVLLASASLAFAVAVCGQAQAAPDLDIRFCPEARARPYPLDSLRGVQGLLLQNLAVVSHAPVSIESVDIELMRQGEPIDRRRISGPMLASAIKGGQALKAQGMLDLVAFQFCDGRLLQGVTPATATDLKAGEAVLITQQVFAYKGARDQARVTVHAVSAGKPVEASAAIPLDGAVSKTVFRWPLKRGSWLIGAGASFHTTHRWAVPEEFALDIVGFAPSGRSFRTDGARHADFVAYDAEVVAAADGTVARIVSGATEDPPMLRHPGESMQDYYGRISERQARNIAAGPPGFVGDAVVLDHGNSEYSLYAHLRPGSVTVKLGQKVMAGQTVGRLGSSGNSTEPHLHFQVCDRPEAVSCAGVIPNFGELDVANTDGPRPLQSGDIVIVP